MVFLEYFLEVPRALTRQDKARLRAPHARRACAPRAFSGGHRRIGFSGDRKTSVCDFSLVSQPFFMKFSPKCSKLRVEQVYTFKNFENQRESRRKICTYSAFLVLDDPDVKACQTNVSEPLEDPTNTHVISDFPKT